MKVSIIAAVAENGVIGKDNKLIWNLADDMKFFKNMTMGHHVIMGRKNWESIPEKYRPLPGRTNIILSRDKSYNPCCADVHLFDHLEDALELARKNGEEEVFVIGGSEIYKAAFPLADNLYLTHVNASFEGDTWFPEFNLEDWDPVTYFFHQKDDKNEYDFDIISYNRTAVTQKS
ncbi:MAG: dihydrofolate reductase [Cyclobacteriaceae bacterium]|nr:dihydrofolate reductase [Cyclobacteriaceae bacterium]